MKKIILATLCLLASMVGGNAQTRLYVKATGGNNSNTGQSWTAAVQNLDTALNRAKANTSIKEIWVAKGTYVPTQKASTESGTTDRDRAFVLPANVKVYGGFKGTETTLAERPARHSELAEESILSGIIDSTGTAADSVYHVVIVSARTQDSITLDGFTITGGRANGSYAIKVNSNSIFRSSGGGIHAYAYGSGTVTLTHNTIRNNTSASSGAGGVYANASFFGTVTLIHNTISNNTSSSNGSGAYAYVSGTVTMTHNTISNNTSSYSGGGVYAYVFGTVTLTNNTISNNTSSSHGGGVYALADGTTSTVTLTNNTISNNTSSFQGGGVYATGTGKVNIGNTLFWGNRKPTTPTTSSIYRYNGTVNVSYCLLEEANFTSMGAISDKGSNLFAQYPMFADTAKGNFLLMGTSPAINKGCNDSIAGITTDKDGKQRIIGTAVDIGAYEYSAPMPDANKILYVNKQVAKNGLQDGSSWANAIPEFFDALFYADALNKKTSNTVKEIWVAKGTYTPLYKAADTASDGSKTTDRDRTFVLSPNVKVYGGFQGTETSITDRPICHAECSEASKSILSCIASDSLYHIVIASAKNAESITLDGFTITGGSAKGSNSITVNTNSFYRTHGGGGIRLRHG